MLIDFSQQLKYRVNIHLGDRLEHVLTELISKVVECSDPLGQLEQEIGQIESSVIPVQDILYHWYFLLESEKLGEFSLVLLYFIRHVRKLDNCKQAEVLKGPLTELLLLFCKYKKYKKDSIPIDSDLVRMSGKIIAEMYHVTEIIGKCRGLDNSRHYCDLPKLKTDFPEIFTDEVIGNVAERTVMFGIERSKYLYSLNNNDKIMWWDIHCWAESCFTTPIGRWLEKFGKIGVMRALSRNLAQSQSLPVVTFFSKKQILEHDVKLLPNKDEYQWTGEHANTYAKTYKILEEFCRGEGNYISST